MDVLSGNATDRPHKKRSRAPLDVSGLYSNGQAYKASRDDDGKRRKSSGQATKSWLDELTEDLFGFVPDDVTQKNPSRKRRNSGESDSEEAPPLPPGPDQPPGLEDALGDSSDQADFGYDQPIHFVDHSEAFSRLKLFAETTYKNYTKQLSELLQTKAHTYANPIHSRRGFDGDLRMHQLRQDLLGFEDKPIEIQMKMHEAGFAIEGPLVRIGTLPETNSLITSTDIWGRIFCK